MLSSWSFEPENRVKPVRNFFAQNGTVTTTGEADYCYSGEDVGYKNCVGSDTYYYVTDSLGTPWRMVDASGTVVWAATYSAFGEATTIPALTTVDQPLRMPGQYFDQESGLHYNLARYYDPSIGRYLSVDPLRDAEDYGYAAGNPLKYVDPTGEVTIRIPNDPAQFGEWAGEALSSYDDIDSLIAYLKERADATDLVCGYVGGVAGSRLAQGIISLAGLSPTGVVAKFIVGATPPLAGIFLGDKSVELERSFRAARAEAKDRRLRDLRDSLRREYEHKLIEEFRTDFPKAEARILDLNEQITRKR